MMTQNFATINNNTQTYFGYGFMPYLKDKSLIYIDYYMWEFGNRYTCFDEIDLTRYPHEEYESRSEACYEFMKELDEIVEAINVTADAMNARKKNEIRPAEFNRQCQLALHYILDNLDKIDMEHFAIMNIEADDKYWHFNYEFEQIKYKPIYDEVKKEVDYDFNEESKLLLPKPGQVKSYFYYIYSTKKGQVSFEEERNEEGYFDIIVNDEDYNETKYSTLMNSTTNFDKITFTKFIFNWLKKNA